MKKLKSENPCLMGLLSRGGGQHRVAIIEKRDDFCKNKYVSKLVSKEDRKEEYNHKCHSGLDPESIPRHERECPAGQILNQVQDDNKGMTSVSVQRGAIRKDNPPLMNLTSYRLKDLTSCLAFTMAEILLSLTIIGVVAAITLPSLTGNINERTWNTQRKALYARMSQAISLMPALNGYGTLVEGDSSTSAQDTTTETFLTAGLSKVLKINNICDNTHLADCGIATTVTNMAGSKIPLPTTLYTLNNYFSSVAYCGYSFSTINTNAAAFETQNGESITAYYNPSCRTELLEAGLSNAGNIISFANSNMCVNFIYDLNGTKGPNTIGKDIGIITVFNATDSTVVAPMPSSPRNAGQYNWANSSKACTAEDSESRLPNLDELSAMFINKNIMNLTEGSGYGFWSSTVDSSTKAWFIHTDTGVKGSDLKTWEINVRCIKR